MILAVLGFVSKPAMPHVAYVARYYGVGQKTPQAFVCNWDGSSRVRVSNGKEECTGVWWLGRDRLLLATWEKDENHLYIVKNGKGFARIAVDTNALPKGFTLADRFGRDRGRIYLEAADQNYELNQRGQIAKFALNTEDAGIGESNSVTIGGKKLFLESNQDQDEWSVVEGTNKKKLVLDTVGLKSRLEKGRLFLRAWTHDSTTGSHYWVHAVDAATLGSKQVIAESGSIEIDFKSPVYVRTSCRDLIPLGKKREWGNSAYTGNWQTGAKEKEIIKGKVYVQTVSVQPA